MCGIAGRIGAQPLAPERIALTLERMRWRGPDHQSRRGWQTARGKHLDLLHSRLSIIDMEPRSHQPFGIGDHWIVFNGELYNYRELRADLVRAGYEPRTESDTEILLASIIHFGWDVLDRMEGMWAFAIYDASDDSVTLCRDRFGEKPLYLFESPDQICFGSEIKLIESLSGERLEVNQQHLLRFMVNGYKSLYKNNSETFYKGVRELPPGSRMTIDGRGRITVSR